MRRDTEDITRMVLDKDMLGKRPRDRPVSDGQYPERYEDMREGGSRGGRE